mmetsp:Transcript_81452/g.225591  ORF Transcript_81452/g.225591 Transcript_81452/m.225591 type:complete len:200 (+) Transcript_81452:1043-1642(+)
MRLHEDLQGSRVSDPHAAQEASGRAHGEELGIGRVAPRLWELRGLGEPDGAYGCLRFLLLCAVWGTELSLHCTQGQRSRALPEKCAILFTDEIPCVGLSLFKDNGFRYREAEVCRKTPIAASVAVPPPPEELVELSYALTCHRASVSTSKHLRIFPRGGDRAMLLSSGVFIEHTSNVLHLVRQQRLRGSLHRQRRPAHA